MKALILMLAAAALVPAASKASTEPPGDQPRAQITEKVQALELKGDLARIHRDSTMATVWYRQAIALDKRNPVLYNKLGIAELELGEKNDARKAFSDAIRRDPKYVDALNNLGAVYCLQWKYKPALKYLKQALALDESKAATHLNLAEAWMGLKQMDRAMTEYARALELDADILSSSDREGVFAQISTPQQQAIVSFLIAKAYAKRGNVEGALDYLQRAKQQGYTKMASVYTEPDFSALWQDPRLGKIVKR